MYQSFKTLLITLICTTALTGLFAQVAQENTNKHYMNQLGGIVDSEKLSNSIAKFTNGKEVFDFLQKKGSKNCPQTFAIIAPEIDESGHFVATAKAAGHVLYAFLEAPIPDLVEDRELLIGTYDIDPKNVSMGRGKKHEPHLTYVHQYAVNNRLIEMSKVKQLMLDHEYSRMLYVFSKEGTLEYTRIFENVFFHKYNQEIRGLTDKEKRKFLFWIYNFGIQLVPQGSLVNEFENHIKKIESGEARYFDGVNELHYYEVSENLYQKLLNYDGEEVNSENQNEQKNAMDCVEYSYTTPVGPAYPATQIEILQGAAATGFYNIFSQAGTHLFGFFDFPYMDHYHNWLLLWSDPVSTVNLDCPSEIITSHPESDCNIGYIHINNRLTTQDGSWQGWLVTHYSPSEIDAPDISLDSVGYFEDFFGAEHPLGDYGEAWVYAINVTHSTEISVPGCQSISLNPMPSVWTTVVQHGCDSITITINDNFCDGNCNYYWLIPDMIPTDQNEVTIGLEDYFLVTANVQHPFAGEISVIEKLFYFQQYGIIGDFEIKPISPQICGMNGYLNYYAYSGLDSLNFNITNSSGTVFEGLVPIGSERIPLPPGSYNLLVSDPLFCDTLEYNFVVNESQIETQEIVINAGCGFVNQNSIEITDVYGGAYPYTYSYIWSNGSTEQGIYDIEYGEYSVTITDANDCFVVREFLLEDDVTSSIGGIELHASEFECGDNFGVINAEVNGGGNYDYSYEWSHVSYVYSHPQIKITEPGVYSVTVTDQGGCQASAEIEVMDVGLSHDLEFEAPCDTFSVGRLEIHEGDDPYEVSGILSSGDTALVLEDNYDEFIFQYNWKPGDTLFISVEDDDGCLGQLVHVHPDQPSFDIEYLCQSGPFVTVTITTEMIYDRIGLHQVDSGFSYAYSAYNTNSYSGSIPTGVYVPYVRIGDCIVYDSDTLVLESTDIYDISLSSSNVACLSDDFIIIENHSPDLSYEFTGNGLVISNDTLFVGQDFSPGTLVVTDEFCSIVQIFINDYFQQMLIKYDVLHADCGQNNGAVIFDEIVDVYGGTPPYAFNWSNGETTASIYDVAPGHYTVTVTDANGCTDTASLAVTAQGSNFTIDGNITNIICSGVGGSIELNINGEPSYYTYAWSNGATTQNIYDLGAGEYSAVVTNDSGCTVSESFVVEADMPNPTLEFNITDPGCYQTEILLGISELELLNDYFVEWTLPNGSVQNTNNTNTLPVVASSDDDLGTYTAEITASECTWSVSVNVDNVFPHIKPLQDTIYACAGDPISIVTEVYSYFFAFNGFIGEDPTGQIYDDWIPSSSDIIDYEWAIMNPVSGIYEMSFITGECIMTTSVYVVVNDNPTVDPTFQHCDGSDLLLSANTNCGGCSTYWEGPNGFTSTLPSPGIAHTTLDAQGLYTVTVTDSNGCSSVDSVEVVLGLPLFVNISKEGDLCNIGNMVTFTAEVDGDPDDYLFNWSTGDTTQSITYSISDLLSDDDLSVEVNIDGCTASASIPIGVLADVVSITNVEIVDAVCGIPGEASINVGGGSGDYFFDFGYGSASQNGVASLPAGSYTVTISDIANGCEVTEDIVIDDVGVGPGIQIEQADNILEVIVTSGGTPPFSYQWSTGEQDTIQTVQVPVSGTYTVTVVDANGCVSTASTTITLTSVEILEEELGLQIYPNPTEDILNIISIKEIDNIIVRDILGRIIIDIVGARENILYFDGYPSGTYVIILQIEDTTITRKIVVR